MNMKKSRKYNEYGHLPINLDRLIIGIDHFIELYDTINQTFANSVYQSGLKVEFTPGEALCYYEEDYREIREMLNLHLEKLKASHHHYNREKFFH